MKDLLFWVKLGGPVTIVGGALLFLMDIFSIVFYDDMYDYDYPYWWDDNINFDYDDYYVDIFAEIPMFNLINSGITLLYGVLLTIFARMSNHVKALLAWIILDALLIAYGLAMVFTYAAIMSTVPTLYAFQAVWRK